MESSSLLRFYDLLLRGDAEALLGLFDGEPEIDTPLSGAVHGEAAFREWIAASRAWLQGLVAAPRLLNAIETEERVVAELVLDAVRDGDPFDLPVALVAERKGPAFGAIRVYHSTWPLTGEHILRRSLLTPPAVRPEEPAIVQAYMVALEAADEPAMLALFVEDGYVREPSGERFRHAGPEGRKAFYDGALGTGGVVLHHCTATFDGRSFAVEYVCDEWGGVRFPPQAGMAVYEVAGPDLLRAVRIYDDVTPPGQG